MHILRIVTGALLIIIGLVALVTPFTPGAIIMLIAGFQLVGWGHLIPKRIKDMWKKSSPT